MAPTHPNPSSSRPSPNETPTQPSLSEEDLLDPKTLEFVSFCQRLGALDTKAYLPEMPLEVLSSLYELAQCELHFTGRPPPALAGNMFEAATTLVAKNPDVPVFYALARVANIATANATFGTYGTNAILKASAEADLALIDAVRKRGGEIFICQGRASDVHLLFVGINEEHITASLETWAEEMSRKIPQKKPGLDGTLHEIATLPHSKSGTPLGLPLLYSEPRILQDLPSFSTCYNAASLGIETVQRQRLGEPSLSPPGSMATSPSHTLSETALRDLRATKEERDQKARDAGALQPTILEPWPDMRSKFVASLTDLLPGTNADAIFDEFRHTFDPRTGWYSLSALTSLRENALNSLQEANSPNLLVEIEVDIGNMGGANACLPKEQVDDLMRATIYFLEKELLSKGLSTKVSRTGGDEFRFLVLAPMHDPDSEISSKGHIQGALKSTREQVAKWNNLPLHPLGGAGSEDPPDQSANEVYPKRIGDIPHLKEGPKGLGFYFGVRILKNLGGGEISVEALQNLEEEPSSLVEAQKKRGRDGDNS